MVVLGLDIGGSTSRGRLAEDGRVIADAVAPGANVASIDPLLVEERLAGLVERLGSPRPAACCAGAAGSEVPAARLRLEELLAKLLPGAKVAVVHDARLVLAAAGLDTGIALIAGTGSVAYARDGDGRETRAGGWGWLLGDEGSGTWIAREAMRELSRRREEGEPMGVMGAAMLAATDARDLLDAVGRVLRYEEPRRWAELARVVFASAPGDDGAARIVDRAAEELALLVERVAARLGVRGPVVMAGGLLSNEPALVARVQARIGTASLLREEPVAGAVRIAERL